MESDESLVRDACHRARLGDETAARRAPGKFAIEDFERDLASEIQVRGRVHDAHGATTELAQDAVARPGKHVGIALGRQR